MKKNMNKADSVIRILIAVAIAVLYFNGIISGTVALVAGAVAVIFVLTGLFGFCPLYRLFGLSTRRRE